MLKSLSFMVLLGLAAGPALTACVPGGGGSGVSTASGSVEQQSLYERLNDQGYRPRSRDED